jgi:16S rRNA processing protein RimM
VNPPQADAPGWVAVALLGKTRGNRGELTAVALSGKPERFQALREVYLVRQGALTGEPHRVEFAWFHRGCLVLKFQGVDSISDAERLVGAEVQVPIAERIALEPGEFFQSDLVGCQVIDRRSGENLGRVEGWEDSGGAGLLAVEGGLSIPFARSICVEIDPASRRILVELPQGLKDLNRP